LPSPTSSSPTEAAVAAAASPTAPGGFRRRHSWMRTSLRRSPAG